MVYLLILPIPRESAAVAYGLNVFLDSWTIMFVSTQEHRLSQSMMCKAWIAIVRSGVAALSTNMFIPRKFLRKFLVNSVWSLYQSVKVPEKPHGLA